MKFLNLETDRVYTLQETKKNYEEIKKDCPRSCCDTFSESLYHIIEACIMQENNYHVIGMTKKETFSYWIKLQNKVFKGA